MMSVLNSKVNLHNLTCTDYSIRTVHVTHAIHCSLTVGFTCTFSYDMC